MANTHKATETLNELRPQMLRARSEAVPQLSGIQRAHDIGQAFEWALDRSRITKQDAAFRMGYTDSGVIGRWISGKENLQIAKVWLIGEGFFQEFVIALAEVAKCEIETTVKIRRTA